jgi:hypothetical protein
MKVEMGVGKGWGEGLGGEVCVCVWRGGGVFTVLCMGIEKDMMN